MSEFQCKTCGMGVKGMSCAKCGSPLKHGHTKTTDGRDVQVCECPKKCGKIKSPTCCGQDMKCVGAQ